MTYFTADKTPLLNFISDALTAGGFTESNSNIVAEHLVDAEMKGVPSHGVNRLGLYIAEAKKGIIDPRAEPIIEQKSPIITATKISTLKEIEMEAIKSSVERNKWNMTTTAEELGISRMTLYRKLEQYGLRSKN